METHSIFMAFFVLSKKVGRFLKSNIYLLLASFCWSLSLNARYLAGAHRRQLVYHGLSVWLILFFALLLAGYIFGLVIKRADWAGFWQSHFLPALAKIAFIITLAGSAVFATNDKFSLIMVFLVQLVFWIYLYRLFKAHPNRKVWQEVIVKAAVFELACFVGVSALQFYAKVFYIYDFRSVASDSGYAVVARTMPMVLVFCLSWAGILFLKSSRKPWKIFACIWLSLMIVWQVFWLINLSILHFSGLLLSPLAMAHAEGSAELFNNDYFIGLMAFFALILAAAIYGLYGFFLKRPTFDHRPWFFVGGLFAVIILADLPGIAIFTGAPEYLVVKSFLGGSTAQSGTRRLDERLAGKLSAYGIKIDQERNFLAYRKNVYREQRSMDPARAVRQKPNIIIVFLESFSARLTGVYNPKLADLTPGLERMAQDGYTTVFKHFYNSASPTTPALIAHLCSIALPTGQNDIDRGKGLFDYQVPCLPKLLKQYGAYQTTMYLTSVNKNFGHKAEALAGTGIDQIFGQAELEKLIVGPPLSWGYSDHQLFPILSKLARQSKEPFLIMHSTVDTHQPFTMVQDMVKYGNGQNDMLNAIHTTDDAFARFWNDFKQSPLSGNTIVVAVADHAMFPAVYQSSDGQDYSPPASEKATLYDEILFMIYNPLIRYPDEVSVYSSSVDLAPTLLQILDLNVSNFFEGHSIFDDRASYPDLMGMNESELYLNQSMKTGRQRLFGPPVAIDQSEKTDSSDLSLPELKQYYLWKEALFR